MANTVLNADGTLNNEFKTQLVSLVNGLMETEEVQYSDVVKEFVEGQINDLQNKLLNNEKWVDTQKSIDALLKVFDANKNGVLSPAEILSKFGALKADLDSNTANIKDVSAKLESNVKDLTAQIAAHEEAIKGVKDNIVKLSQDVENKVTEAKKAAADLTTAVKTELTGKVDAVDGKAAQISTKLDSVDAMVNGTVSAIEGVAEAFQTAAGKINDRMAKVRAAFGLKVETQSTQSTQGAKTQSTQGTQAKTSNGGDGAVV